MMTSKVEKFSIKGKTTREPNLEYSSMVEDITDPELLRLREKFGAEYIKQSRTYDKLARRGLNDKLFPLVTKFLESTRTRPHGLSEDQLDTVKAILLHLESKEQK